MKHARLTPVSRMSGSARQMILLLAGFGLCFFLAGLLIGMLWLGPHWYAQWYCLRDVAIPMPPHEFAVCALP
jgi:hypothetical protein